MAETTDNKPVLLVVEDDLGLQEQLTWALDSFTVILANHREAAMAKLRRFEPGVVTLDLGLPPDPHGTAEGLRTLQEILSIAPDCKVIMVTGQKDRSIAMQAIQLGAYDFYTKPIDAQALQCIIQRAFYLYMLEKEHAQLKQVSFNHTIQGMITGAASMVEVCRTVQKVAPNNISVLLLGESGTGKEVLARAIHAHSERSKGPFVAINCAAIPENLLESELFGYEKGAFTGASKQTRGKIELAHQGTLFLDEIGDLPLALQPKLLRFLQEKVIERLGGRSGLALDVRIVCATHQNLQQLIDTHRFREDLYYRLSEMSINIPPLRERLGDAVLIARFFLVQFSQAFKKPIKKFSPKALHAIHQYTWPGNVRELENKIKRAVIMSEGQTILASDLDLLLHQEAGMPFNLKAIRTHAEREAILSAMQYCHHNLSKTAERLGITRPTLYHLIEKLCIPVVKEETVE